MASFESLVRAETPPADYPERLRDLLEDGSLRQPLPLPSCAPVLAAPEERPFRVLIVEDDRSQALFAQSVLAGAGIEAIIESNPQNVLPQLPETTPDLILLDLHLKDIDGITLTTMIRQYPHLQLLPIVFLSGDPDPERQYEVLAIGADDFLTKPIRPRHLIAAVSNRIQRARQQARALGLATARDPAALPAPGNSDALPAANNITNPDTGLPTRQFVISTLQAMIDQQRQGHTLFVEVAGAIGLRERFGYASFERLMLQAGQTVATTVKPHPVARLNDHSFLVVADQLPDVEAAILALHVREALANEPVKANDAEMVQLRSAIGYAPLPADFGTAHQVIEAAEIATIDARLAPTGIQLWTPRPSAQEVEQLSLLEGHLEPAYQPIVAVSGEQSAQFQVLLRLRKPDGTLLSAGQVIPAAEAAGRIIDLDQQVLEHALDLLDRYRHSTMPMRLFVTQSPRSLMHDGFIEWLDKALRQRQLAGEPLVIDIRLPDARIHGVSLAQLGNRLRELNVRLCLSQFDPDPDAIAVAKMLPLSYLRLSARFANDHNDPDVRAALAQVQQLAREQGTQLIAQQVEDPQAAAAMWLGGIDFLQGNMVQSVGNNLDFDFHNAAL